VSTCLAVGQGTSKTGAWKSVAEVWRSGVWKPVTVNSPGSTAKLSNLLGVSCKTAGYCLAVGLYGPNMVQTTPYAAAWTGSALAPVAKLPVPTSLSTVYATAVSCVAVRSCVVIGTGFDESGITTPGGFLGYVSIVWTWNGGKWTVQTVPDKNNDAMLTYNALRCFSLTSCVSAGGRLPQIAGGGGVDTGDEVPLLATWNGKAFTAMRAPVPSVPANTAQQFASVSCSSLSSCAVAGVSDGNSTTSFLDVWNGRSWKLTKWSGPKGTTSAGLFDVSCASASRCLAVGAAGTDIRPVAAALAWNGVTWTATKVPGPVTGKMSVFNGVSCPKASECMAIGNTGAVTSSAPLGQLAGYWNGTTWRLAAA
jgi:hypothetical protein